MGCMQSFRNFGNWFRASVDAFNNKNRTKTNIKTAMKFIRFKYCFIQSFAGYQPSNQLKKFITYSGLFPLRTERRYTLYDCFGQ